MDVYRQLDQLLASPECHAVLVNALGEYGSVLMFNAECFADEYELARIERSSAQVDALRDVFECWT